MLRFIKYIIIVTGLFYACVVHAQTSDHFTFMKECLAAWGTSDYPALRNVLVNYKELGLIEQDVFSVELFTPFNYEAMSPKYEQLKSKVKTFIDDGYYSDLSGVIPSNEVSKNISLIKQVSLGGDVVSTQTSIDEALSDKVPAESFSASEKKLIIDNILRDIQVFFIFRKDVLLLVKNEGKMLLNSPDMPLPEEQPATPNDILAMTNSDFVSYLLGKYYNGKIRRIERDDRPYIIIDLTPEASPWKVLLMGTFDDESMKSSIDELKDPATGRQLKGAEKLDAAWYLVVGEKYQPIGGI